MVFRRMGLYLGWQWLHGTVAGFDLHLFLFHVAFEEAFRNWKIKKKKKIVLKTSNLDVWKCDIFSR